MAEWQGPWCAWLRCAHCDRITLHAVIVDALADTWRRDACDREQHDRLVDRNRRRIHRRLRALAAEGVTVVRAPSVKDMSLDDSLVEIIEYVDDRRLLLRVRPSGIPTRILRAVELTEDLLDGPDRLGPWVDDAAGLLRGIAITDP